jgi:hypothetical protein
MRTMNLQGGKTCAESPHKITLPNAHWLQLRAENVKGRHRSVSIQSLGYCTSCAKLKTKFNIDEDLEGVR